MDKREQPHEIVLEFLLSHGVETYFTFQPFSKLILSNIEM